MSMPNWNGPAVVLIPAGAKADGIKILGAYVIFEDGGSLINSCYDSLNSNQFPPTLEEVRAFWDAWELDFPKAHRFITPAEVAARHVRGVFP